MGSSFFHKYIKKRRIESWFRLCIHKRIYLPGQQQMRQKATIAVDRLVYKPPRLSSHRINKKYGAICPGPLSSSSCRHLATKEGR
jgi:hypothetical protein